MGKASNIIITLYSAETVQLDDDSAVRILNGDYPIRVKSKILATIRELCARSDKENIVGFLPVSMNRQDVVKHFPVATPEDITQDHYGELALYLSPEIPCRIVSDLLRRGKDGSINCREDIVRGSSIIVISDSCSDWSEAEACMEKAGAESVRFISIVKQ